MLIPFLLFSILCFADDYGPIEANPVDVIGKDSQPVEVYVCEYVGEDYDCKKIEGASVVESLEIKTSF